MISIMVVTYNQEKYIRQCLDSVLMQNLDTDFEILIGEDGSTDGTAEICEEYVIKNPEKIKIIKGKRDEVIFIEGKPTGRRNLLNLLMAVSGKYIALIEGDDYWTDKNKLQKQFNYLEKHPEAAVCFHNALIVDEINGVERLFHKNKIENVLGTKELIKSNFIPTASVFFRANSWIKQPPQWFLKFRAGDWGMHLINSLYGELHYINETMSVYRYNESSGWQTQNRRNQINQVIVMFELLIAEKDFNSYISNIENEIKGKKAELALLGNKKPSSPSILKSIYNKILKRK